MSNGNKKERRPSDLLRTPEGRAKIDSLANLMGFPLAVSPSRGRGRESENYGEFNTPGSILSWLTGKQLPGEAGEVWLSDQPIPGLDDQGMIDVMVHEGEHSRDFHSRGPVGKLLNEALFQGANLWNILTGPALHVQNPIEYRAELATQANRIASDINSYRWEGPPMSPLELAVARIRNVGAGPTRSPGYGYELDPKDLIRKIQEISRHPDMRGSLIRRALLQAGFGLR